MTERSKPPYETGGAKEPTKGPMVVVVDDDLSMRRALTNRNSDLVRQHPDYVAASPPTRAISAAAT